jgi:hypothetical protein
MWSGGCQHNKCQGSPQYGADGQLVTFKPDHDEELLEVQCSASFLRWCLKGQVGRDARSA